MDETLTGVPEVLPLEGVAAQSPGVEPVSPTGVTDSATTTEASEGANPQVASNEEAGRIDAIRAERDRRQAAEERARINEDELKIYKQQLQEIQARNQQQTYDPLEGLEDDDLVSAKTVRDYQRQIKDTITGEIQRQKIETSSMFARTKYNDFDDVIKDLPNVANPNQLYVILNDANPAERAYWFMKSTPEYVNKATQNTTQKVAQQTIDTINNHLNRPKTLSNTGGGNSLDKGSMIKSMSDAEFDKYVNKVLYGGR